MDEHLLWIRSAKSIGMRDLKNLVPALKWLFSPDNGWQVAQNLVLSVMRHPIVWIRGLLIPITLGGLRRKPFTVHLKPSTFYLSISNNGQKNYRFPVFHRAP